MKLNPFFHKIARIASTVLTVFGIQVSAYAADPPEDSFDMDHPEVRSAKAVQHEVTPGMMKSADVLGTAIGVDDTGRAHLIVYVDRDSRTAADTIRALPARTHGKGVRVELTDKFYAYAAHTAKQSTPIQLGTSGGWTYDLANGYCCSGTLGSLIQVNGIQYIMSNYHVMEADIVSGGNGIVANTGDGVIQPGLVDVNCTAANAQVVGTLVKISSLPNSNVDVGIAQVAPGMVSSTGAILEIGTISKDTVNAKLRKGVKKSGRTSGLTSSSISGLNATVRVTYENECAGGTAFTKTFTGQIIISNKGNKFLAAGDSGSLMVENVSTNPRAIGLLYAGSSTTAVANPIGQVLQYIGSQLGGTATMVGN